MTDLVLTVRGLDGNVIPNTQFKVSPAFPDDTYDPETSLTEDVLFTTDSLGVASLSLPASTNPYYVTRAVMNTDGMIAYKLFVPATAATLTLGMVYVDLKSQLKLTNDKALYTMIESKVSMLVALEQAKTASTAAGLNASLVSADKATTLAAKDDAISAAAAAGVSAAAAAVSKGLADTAQIAAETAKDDAESARDAAFGNAAVYASTAAGLAAVADGVQFQVVVGDEIIRYVRTDAVTATEVARFYSKAYLDSVLPQAPVSASLVPLLEDSAGNVPLWLEDGNLAAKGLAGSFIGLIRDGVGVSEISGGSRLVPLAFDDAESVAVWLEDGLLDAKGIGGNIAAAIDVMVASRVEAMRFAPLNSPSDSSLPAYTDGRSLFAWRSRIAKLLRTGTGQAKVLLTGDSWTEYVAIPQQLSTLLYAAYGKASEGWISVNGTYTLNGVTLAKSGWTNFDASTGASPINGCGMDGQAIIATGAAATVTIGALTTTNLDIYYRNTTGIFRYRVDGGSWVTVTGSGTNALGKASITGLSNAAHTIEIDTTGNAGTVVLYGFRATRPSVAGVELLKAGNAGLTGTQMLGYAGTYVAGIVADIMPDIVIVILGTNDYRLGSSVANYTAGLSALVTAVHSVSPSTGFIFVAPAESSATPIIPLTDFRDALYFWCIDNGHEFYNMHDEWGDYATMASLGMWVDALHLNNDGAEQFARRLNSKFLTI